jgi:hypothetical protein
VESTLESLSAKGKMGSGGSVHRRLVKDNGIGRKRDYASNAAGGGVVGPIASDRPWAGCSRIPAVGVSGSEGNAEDKAPCESEEFAKRGCWFHGRVTNRVGLLGVCVLMLCYDFIMDWIWM